MHRGFDRSRRGNDDRDEIFCYHCGGPGHFKRNCPVAFKEFSNSRGRKSPVNRNSPRSRNSPRKVYRRSNTSSGDEHISRIDQTARDTNNDTINDGTKSPASTTVKSPATAIAKSPASVTVKSPATAIVKSPASTKNSSVNMHENSPRKRVQSSPARRLHELVESVINPVSQSNVDSSRPLNTIVETSPASSDMLKAQSNTRLSTSGSVTKPTRNESTDPTEVLANMPAANDEATQAAAQEEQYHVDSHGGGRRLGRVRLHNLAGIAVHPRPRNVDMSVPQSKMDSLQRRYAEKSRELHEKVQGLEMMMNELDTTRNRGQQSNSTVNSNNQRTFSASTRPSAPRPSNRSTNQQRFNEGTRRASFATSSNPYMVPNQPLVVEDMRRASLATSHNPYMVPQPMFGLSANPFASSCNGFMQPAMPMMPPAMAMVPPTQMMPPFGSMPPTQMMPPFGSMPPTQMMPPFGAMPFGAMFSDHGSDGYY